MEKRCPLLATHTLIRSSISSVGDSNRHINYIVYNHTMIIFGLPIVLMVFILHFSCFLSVRN